MQVLQLPEYRVRYIERFPLGTPYPAIVDAVEDLLSDRTLLGRTRLVVDGTGVGVPVVNMFQLRGVPLLPIWITAGDAVSSNGRILRVPKRDLVSVLQVLFQSRRLKIARDLPEAGVLFSELMNFSAKITTKANETYEAWREGQHDDLVLALALACWSLERSPKPGVKLQITGLGKQRSLLRSE